jgi:hypothetical protein
MPRVPFWPIGPKRLHSELHCQNSLSLPLAGSSGNRKERGWRRSVFEGEKGAEEGERDTEHSEKERRKAEQAAQQEEAWRGEAECGGQMRRADESWEKMNKLVAEGGFGRSLFAKASFVQFVPCGTDIVGNGRKCYYNRS